MSLDLAKSKNCTQSNEDDIAYVRQMLNQLRRITGHDGNELLCYLIDMAYIEAGETQDKLSAARLSLCHL